MNNPQHQPYPTDQDRRWVYIDSEIDFRQSHVKRLIGSVFWLAVVVSLTLAVLIAQHWKAIAPMIFACVLFFAMGLPQIIYTLRFHRVEIDRDANTCKARTGFLGRQHRKTFALSDFVCVRIHKTTYTRYKFFTNYNYKGGSGYHYDSVYATPVAIETRDGVLVDLLCFEPDIRKHAEALASWLKLPLRLPEEDKNPDASRPAPAFTPELTLLKEHRHSPPASDPTINPKKKKRKKRKKPPKTGASPN